MLSLIGNPPSCGSTFLADLLDSTPFTASGEEIGTFSNVHLYNSKTFRTVKNSRNLSLHTYRNGTKEKYLHHYGLNREKQAQMLKNSRGVEEYSERFIQYYLALRGKPLDATFFENTPENINVIGEFLETFDDGFFIFLIRNPLYVYPSLLKRRFPDYVALTTWLIDVSKYFSYCNHPRVLTVKYEDLVGEPFLTVSNIIKTITGRCIVPSDIEAGYRFNHYRRLHGVRLNTWSAREFGVVHNANAASPSHEVISALAPLLQCKISLGYAQEFGLCELSFKEALNHFGYFDDFVQSVGNSGTEELMPLLNKTVCDVSHICLKWLLDFFASEASLSSLPHYLNPIELVSRPTRIE